MLSIVVPKRELWDERTEEFVYVKEQKLVLEHSLVSLSKWEARWKKAFFGKKEKTEEEIVDYVRCMTITQNVNPQVYNYLTESNIMDIKRYIEDPMTATVLYSSKEKQPNRETVTSELIYYWMISLNIPFKCEKWHINRLLTLIDVCSRKNQPPKKMSQKALMSRNAALNAQRRQRLKTNG